MFHLPEAITVVDVSARDGLQSFSRWVPTNEKIRMIDRLSSVGFPVIEVTGMVHPRVVPNLSDAELVLEGIVRRPGTTYRALVPNARGALRASKASAPPDEILGLIVASDRYLQKNQGMSTGQAIDEVIRSFEIASSSGMSFVVAIAGAFWDVYEGRTPISKVKDLLARFHEAGIRKAYLAGSLGVEDPVHVNRLFSEMRSQWPDLELGFHVHNLAGLATANILAALDAGASFVEGSICGIGGGIAMPGKIDGLGNLASEDIVYLLNEMGIETGLDTDNVVAAARDIARQLDIEPASYLARCGTRREIFKGGEA